MTRPHFIVGIALITLIFACADEEPSPAPTTETAGSDGAMIWRLIITRADRTVETVLSSEAPQVCGSQEAPKVLFFCGRAVGETRAPFWDFLPVNVGEGDTYAIESPRWLTPEPTPTTPTPTVIAP